MRFSYRQNFFDGPEVKAKDVIIASAWNLVDRSLTSVELNSLSDILPSTVDTRLNARALSKNEQAKPIRVRALVMTINSNLPPQIHEARVEALKKENIKGENLHGMDKEFGNRLDGTLCIMRRSWLPCIRDLGELIKHESHKSNYFIHPGIG
ncbi:hypothetical protein Tco_1473681 [Tanacetum coccineum]